MRTSLKMYTIYVCAIALHLFIAVHSLISINNLKCVAMDKSFSDFEYCYIKAVNRSYKYISIRARLLKVPVNNVTIGINVQKRANGYHPFLYNFEVDACKFLKDRKHPILNYFYGFIDKVSNMNHTCPYNHDVIIENLGNNILDNQLTKVLPVPEGEYAVLTTWKAYNILRSKVTFYVKIGN